jgi:aminomethyltransferase
MQEPLAAIYLFPAGVLGYNSGTKIEGGFTVGQRTPLYQQHLAAGAKIVDFAGWDMPLHYGSQIAEHKLVREHAGVFDVSHMTIIDVDGAQALGFLRKLLAGDVGRLAAGMALYTIMLNEDGGIVDDLIVYRRAQGYRLVVNCGTREKDLKWLQAANAGYVARLVERPNLAILAVHVRGGGAGTRRGGACTRVLRFY